MQEGVGYVGGGCLERGRAINLLVGGMRGMRPNGGDCWLKIVLAVTYIHPSCAGGLPPKCIRRGSNVSQPHGQVLGW